MEKLLYVSDVSLPNKSAYAVHVMKMCEAFSEQKEVDLVVNHNSEKWKVLKRNYNLKNNINIISLNNFKVGNFFFRIINAYKTLKLIKKNNYKIIISRNIITSTILAFYGLKNILEIHTELTGLTKKIFFLFLKKNKKNLKFIFIHRNLNSFFKLKKNFIILDDAINLKDFNNIKNKTIKNKFVYTGSLIKGKGIELILELAAHFRNYKFFLYGNLDTFPKSLNPKRKMIKNLIVNDFIEYSKIPSVLKSAEFLLMPYPKKAGVLMRGIDVQDYISPLKMFEYLAAKKIIFASHNEAYKHILINNFNSLIIEPENKTKWINKINYVLNNKKKFNKLKKNSFKTVKKYTWEKRSEKILNFALKK
tara:strand:- start:17954 stop:19042 length:1089 start_codon:yes stop_codon:yes gene_type:complete